MTEQSPTSLAYTIRTKIGESEFEASGPREDVREDYEKFLAALPNENTRRDARQVADALGMGQLGGVGATTEIKPGEMVKGVTPELVARAFSIRGDSVTLNALPRSEEAEADALLLLLWGFEHLKSQTSVGATALTEAARVSGLSVDRVDRVIARRRDCFVRAGQRKGTRYSLNNPGRNLAGTLLSGLYQ